MKYLILIILVVIVSCTPNERNVDLELPTSRHVWSVDTWIEGQRTLAIELRDGEVYTFSVVEWTPIMNSTKTVCTLGPIYGQNTRQLSCRSVNSSDAMFVHLSCPSFFGINSMDEQTRYKSIKIKCEKNINE